MAKTNGQASNVSADEASGSAPWRADIQGLRAIAVMGVFVYHLSPHRLSGGYVGVDVFFVISGFLITGHLLRQPIGSGGDLLNFWARRVRRLLPAAALVLLATLAATAIWLPVTVRSEVAREVVASAAYVQNWYLANTSTHYLATDVPPGPLQHYWSLSVEEQFYLVWPLLLGALVWLATRSRATRPNWVPAAGIGAALALSLWWSIIYTTAEPGKAYFVTSTRVWELAAGGLLAATAGLGINRLPAWLRAIAAWSGLALIGWAMVTYDHNTVFPGAAAVVPVLGTMLVIAAAVSGLRGGPGPLLDWRPVTWTGDISYSLYLWHWPLVVIAPFVIHGDLNKRHDLAIVVVTFALAAATTKLVEDPIRQGASRLRTGPTFAALGLGLVVVIGSGVLVLSASQRQAAADAGRVRTLLADPPPCFGADAARNPDCEFPGTDWFTDASFAREDRPVLYSDGCWNERPFTTRLICHYGPDDAAVRIALLGNSHAGHWFPAIAQAMAGRDWSVTTYLISECYTVDVAIDMARPAATTNCLEWNRWAVDQVTSGDFDLVVMSNRTARHLVGVPRAERDATAQEAYGRVLARITDSGVPVLVIRDVPTGARNHPDCLARYLHDPGACAKTYPNGLDPDPLADAALVDESGLVEVLDVTDLLCRDGVCPAVIGGVIVFFDHGHLTATMATTLAPEVEAAMLAALALG